LALADGDGGVAAAGPLGLPEQPGAAPGPLLEQPGLLRDAGAVGAAPLRPIVSAAGERRHAQEQDRQRQTLHRFLAAGRTIKWRRRREEGQRGPTGAGWRAEGVPEGSATVPVYGRGRRLPSADLPLI